MELTKKSKRIIAVAVILAVIIIVGVIIGIVVWSSNNLIIGRYECLTGHTFTLEEAKFVKNVLPMVLLLPSNFDGDIYFAYGRLCCTGGIQEKRLSEIRNAVKNNKCSELSAKDFDWLSYYSVEIKNEKYDIEYVVCYDNPISNLIEPSYNTVNNKDEQEFGINRTYYYDRSTRLVVNIYPHNYQNKLIDKYWSELSKDEKIELFGREWFDSVELSDIDEFMKEVCAYNGINSDWLDNKPIYNIK